MARKPDLAKDRIVIVMGAVLPGAKDPRQFRRGHTHDRSGNVPLGPPVCAPYADVEEVLLDVHHSRKFRCMLETSIGTIDEHVAAYRAALTTAVHSYFMTDRECEEDPTPCSAWTANEELQAQLEEWIKSGQVYERDGCYIVPFQLPEKETNDG